MCFIGNNDSGRGFDRFLDNTGVGGASLVSWKLRDTTKAPPWDQFINSLYLLWVVLGAIITLGNTTLFPYARPATAISQITIFLNIRYILTGLFLLVCLVTSIVRAFRGGVRRIPSLPPLTLDSSVYVRPALAALLKPFDIVVNAMVRLLWFVADTIWKLLALLGTYLGRTGKNLANQLYELVFSKDIWKSIIRVLATFVLVVGLVYGTAWVSPTIWSYLTSNVSYSAALTMDSDMRSFWQVVAYFLGTLFAILFFFWIWDYEDQVYQALFGGSMIIVGVGLAGLLMYALAQLKTLAIVGFDRLGPFTFTILCVVGIVFVGQLVRRVSTRSKNSRIEI